MLIFRINNLSCKIQSLFYSNNLTVKEAAAHEAF